MSSLFLPSILIRQTILVRKISSGTGLHSRNFYRNMSNKILVTRKLSDEAMGILQARTKADIVAWPHDSTADRSWVLENVKGAKGVLCMLSDKIDDEFLDAAGSELKALSTYSVGYDHIAVQSAKSKGIKIGYTPDVLTDAVADLTVMLALMALRRGGEATRIVQEGKWPSMGWAPYMLCGSHPAQKTLAFLGLGRISLGVLKRMLPFGVSTHVLYSNSGRHDRTEEDKKIEKELGITLEWVSKEDLAKRGDVLFVLCAGGPATANLVDEKFLSLMKPTSVIVNAARGSVVDSDALAKALGEGRILGAGLDVVAGEPNIGLYHPLVKEPRCVILPHIGSATTETRREMSLLAVENLIQGFNGEQLPVELK